MRLIFLKRFVRIESRIVNSRPMTSRGNSFSGSRRAIRLRTCSNRAAAECVRNISRFDTPRRDIQSSLIPSRRLADSAIELQRFTMSFANEPAGLRPGLSPSLADRSLACSCLSGCHPCDTFVFRDHARNFRFLRKSLRPANCVKIYAGFSTSPPALDKLIQRNNVVPVMRNGAE